jgi:hypothetical protein
MKPTNALKPIWDKVTRNAARLERGMERASVGGGAIAPLVLLGSFSNPIYQEDGLGGLGILVLASAAFAVGLLAMKSRVEINQFDKKKREDYTKDAVIFYEANKVDAPAPA